MRWIDADALIEKFGDWYIEEGPEEGFIGTLGQLLSEQPETNCSEIPNSSDTISRQAAIDALKEKVFRNLTDEFYGAMQVLDELPSAKPVHKTGRWIEMSSTNHTYKCSVCGRLLVNITDGKNNVAKNYPYCHCGADMREENQNECRNNS